MENINVLLIDDEIQIRRFLKVSLESHSLRFSDAKSGKEGLQLFSRTKPDIVILDLGLPDMDGMEVLKSIRSFSETPVIILSARDNESSVIAGLDAGANDYLTKPFGLGELLARMRAAIRSKPSDIEDSEFSQGSLHIDFESRIVKVNGKMVKLTAKEYDLLAFFARNAGKILTHRQILKAVWGGHNVEHSQYLRVYVGHLREKIEPDKRQPQLILTEPGVGYRFCSNE